MIKYQKENIEQEIPSTAICNKSGKEVDLINDINYIEQNMIHSFKVHFGYGSIFDDDVWEFELDENELLEFVKTFKIKPKGFAEGARYPDKAFDEWKSTGKFNWRSGWSEEEINEEKIKREAAKERMKKASAILRKIQEIK